MFWLTGGDSSDWPIVVCDSKFSEEYDLYEMDVTGFLCRWMRKEISPKAFPKNVLSAEPMFAPYADQSSA